MSRTAIFFLMFIAPLLGLALAVLGAISIVTNLTGWFLLAVGTINLFGFALTAVFQRDRFRISVANGPIVQQENGDRSDWMVIPGMVAVFFLPPFEYLWFKPLLALHVVRSFWPLPGAARYGLVCLVAAFTAHALFRAYCGA